PIDRPNVSAAIHRDSRWVRGNLSGGGSCRDLCRGTPLCGRRSRGTEHGTVRGGDDERQRHEDPNSKPGHDSSYSPGRPQRAQRKPLKRSECDGSKSATTSKTPASVPMPKSPPRTNATGRALPPFPPGPPKQLESLPAKLAEVVQSVHGLGPLLSAQSATHSATFPTMSKTPQFDLQLDREPVLTASSTLLTLQSVVPSSVPGSGVPAAAPCHSRFVSSRLPASRHA